MNRLRTILAAVLLATASLGISAVPVAATGDCNAAYVIVYDLTNLNGASRAYCYNISDVDIEGEPGNVMGPQDDGTYSPDFDSSTSTSGVDSFYFYDNTGDGVNLSICFYSGKVWSGTVVGTRTSTGAFQAITLYKAGSIKFTSGAC